MAKWVLIITRTGCLARRSLNCLTTRRRVFRIFSPFCLSFIIQLYVPFFFFFLYIYFSFCLRSTSDQAKNGLVVSRDSLCALKPESREGRTSSRGSLGVMRRISLHANNQTSVVSTCTEHSTEFTEFTISHRMKKK